jgi:hypothetical protein
MAATTAVTERKKRPRGSNDCVRVAVRCRPFKDYEIQVGFHFRSANITLTLANPTIY